MMVLDAVGHAFDDGVGYVLRQSGLVCSMGS